MAKNNNATLDQSLVGDELVVVKVQPPSTAFEWERWLEEIGFVVGERVKLIARAFPGGDPLVVRIGQSTFALRQAEAACIQVVVAENSKTASSANMTDFKGHQA